MSVRSIWRFLQRDVFVSRSAARRRRSRRQSGFAYVMAMIAVMTILIMSQVALKNLVTQGKREAEREEVWRGEQYVRAIRLYYHKTGHYPQTIDDLKKGMPDLHFLRAAAYKDPMNAEGDGEWGFIYVNAAGQLIGSVRYTSLQEMALLDLNNGQLPTNQQAAAAALGSFGIPAAALTNGGISGAAAPGLTMGTEQSPQTPSSGAQQPGSPAPTGDTAQQSAQPGTGQTATAPAENFDSLSNIGQPQPTGPVDGPVLGAFLTGVVSKSKQTSVTVYKGGKKYSEWEFIWNPIEEQAQAVQNGLGSQASPLGLPVANPNAGGSPTVTPANPDNSPNGAQPPAQTPPAQPPASHDDD